MSKESIRSDKITELYKTLLDRDPDDSGLMSYLYSDLSIEEISSAIKSSVEYANLHGKKKSKDKSGEIVKSVGSAELFVMGSSPQTDGNSLSLKKSGIKSILDLNLGSVTYDYTWCDDFSQVPIDPDKPITKKQIDLCFSFIRRNIIENGNKTFIHSKFGRSRAPAMMALFLVADKGLTLFHALRLIHSKQSSVDPSRELISADILEYVYKYRKKYGTKPAMRQKFPGSLPKVSTPQIPSNEKTPLDAQKEKSIIRVTNQMFAGPFIDKDILNELNKVGIKTILDLNVQPRSKELQDSRFSNVHLPLFLDQVDVLMPIITKSINKYLSGGGVYVYCADKAAITSVLDAYVTSNPEILKKLHEDKKKRAQEGNKKITEV